MSNKVERLAAMTDDKTLIASLLRDGSSRIKLIEFKDARADIWQWFRLVQIDGKTLSYAVCVRCMKPVSYKAREGTGGLHRHPCSKAINQSLSAQDLSANSSNSSASNRIIRSSDSASTSSSAHSNHSNPRTTITNSLNKSHTANLTIPTAEHVANLSMNSLLTANLASSFPLLNFPEIKYDQSMSSPEQDDETPALRLLETAIKELIPWQVINDSLHPLINDLWQMDGTEAPSLEPLLTELYRKGYHKVREEICTLDYVPIVVDIWSTDGTDRFATLWISFEHKKQIIKTIDISLVDTYEQLITELDKTRILFCSPLQKHVYCFDNDFGPLVTDPSEEHFLCPLHELNAILDEALLDNSDFPIAKILRKIQQRCAMKANFLSEIVRARTSNWPERFTLIKQIRESRDVLKEIITGDKELELLLDENLWTFLQPYHDAIKAFSTEISMNVVTLWKAKLADHCKFREDEDTDTVKSIKASFNAIKRSITSTIGLISVCLDPRFKKLKMLDADSRDRTYAGLRQLIGKVDGQKNESPNNHQADPESSSNESQSAGNSKRRKTSHLLTSFNEYMDDSNETDKDELDRYLDVDVGQGPDTLEPSEFWSGEYANKFPRLSVIAKQLIIDTPTVSRNCCQLLQSGREFSRRRSVLKIGSHMDEILLLHSLFTT